MNWSALGSKIWSSQDLATAVRAAACVALLWAFWQGNSFLSVRGPAILAMATLLGLLAAYELTIRDAPPGRVLGSVLFIQGLLGGGYMIWLHTRPPEPSGPLVAAGEPSPPPGCLEAPGPDDLTMAFGTDRVIGKGPGPFAPIIVDDCVVLSFNRRPGGLMVRAFGYDWNNDIAFRVMDNVYEPATALQLRSFRPDHSTFVLLDRFDQEVLYVRYLNRNAVRIRGRFLCGEAPQAVIRDNVILVGGIRIAGVFFGQRPTTGHVCAVTKAGGHGIAIMGRP